MKLGVMGAGAWGTALACAAHRAHHEVLVWDINEARISAIQKNHENPDVLPDVRLPESLMATTDLDQLFACDAFLLAIPTQAVRSALKLLKEHHVPSKPLLSASKGIENGSNLLVTEILEESGLFPEMAVLSGPNFALEVAQGLPAITTIGAKEDHVRELFSDFLHGPTFRVYPSSDPLGVELGGALKNVLAIACGIAQGRKLGDNARAAIVTRGLEEMIRLGMAKGAHRETFYGPAGIGDLVLTCMGSLSRNMSFGMRIGHGEFPADVIAEGQTIEGYYTARSVYELIQQFKLDMPIFEHVYRLLYQNEKLDDVLQALLNRPRA